MNKTERKAAALAEAKARFAARAAERKAEKTTPPLDEAAVARAFKAGLSMDRVGFVFGITSAKAEQVVRDAFTDAGHPPAVWTVSWTSGVGGSGGTGEQ